MTAHPISAAATALCAVLEAENAALSAMDVLAATAMVEAKRQATDHLLQQIRQTKLPGTAADKALARRLDALAQQNKTLLERAMLAQNRVMACIARAVPKSPMQGGRYGARGRAPSNGSAPPVALSARA